MTKTLTPDQIESMERAADELDGSLYRGYSGRGMYGDECVGVVLEHEGDVFRFATLLGLDLAEALGSPKFDNMGLNIIAYWPRWTT